MKRAKARSTGARGTETTAGDFFGRPIAAAKTWVEETTGKGDGDFTPYTMSTRFSLGTLVSHSKFGKGVVTEVESQKVNVLFEDGPRKLGHGS